MNSNRRVSLVSEKHGIVCLFFIKSKGGKIKSRIFQISTQFSEKAVERKFYIQVAQGFLNFVLYSALFTFK